MTEREVERERDVQREKAGERGRHGGGGGRWAPRAAVSVA